MRLRSDRPAEWDIPGVECQLTSLANSCPRPVDNRSLGKRFRLLLRLETREQHAPLAFGSLRRVRVCWSDRSGGNCRRGHVLDCPAGRD